MKQLMTGKLWRKMLLLTFLLIGAVFVAGVDYAPPVQASRCCSTCEIPPPGDGEEDVYCENKCGGTGGRECVEECLDSIYGCWATCNTGC